MTAPADPTGVEAERREIERRHAEPARAQRVAAGEPVEPAPGQRRGAAA
ncbi:hypothetical protein [Streptomyces sp. JNUCC 63]